MWAHIRSRYEGSPLKALLLAPVLAALPGIGFHLGRIANAAIVLDAERQDGGSSERWDLLGEQLVSLLTLGTLQYYLYVLVLTAVGTALVLAPVAGMFLYRRWPTGMLKGFAGVIGLLPWVAQTVRILWAGVDGPPVTGLILILGTLCNAVIPLLAVMLFLRFLKPRTTLERSDLRMDEATRERMPFLAQASAKDDRQQD